MNLLDAAMAIAKLAMKLMYIARTGEDMMLYGQDKLESEAAWQDISRIAAEQAAKPSIDGVSLHE